MTIDNRARFRLAGCAVGALAAIWGAIQGDWAFAIVFAVASVVIGIAVLRQIRRSQGDS
jgi:outer membrane lipoprotein SlyB